MIWSRRKLARVVGDHLVAKQHDDAFGMRAHQHHPAGSARIDAVAIMVGHDQASGAGPDGLLDEPVEGARSSIRLARSSWNTSQIVRSLNSGCVVRCA